MSIVFMVIFNVRLSDLTISGYQIYLAYIVMLQTLRLLQPNYKVGSFLWFSLSYLWRELKEHTYKNVCMHVPIYMHTSIILHFS